MPNQLKNFSMEFQISIVSDDEDVAIQDIQSLKKRIENDEEIEGVKIKQERKELQKDDAGGMLLPAIKMVAEMPLVGKIFDAIGAWMVGKNKKMKVAFNKPDGTKFEMEIEYTNEKELMATISKLKKTFGL